VRAFNESGPARWWNTEASPNATHEVTMRHAALFLFVCSALINTVMVLLGLVLIAIWGTTP